MSSLTFKLYYPGELTYLRGGAQHRKKNVLWWIFAWVLSLIQPIHWSATIKGLTCEVNNMDHLVTMQCPLTASSGSHMNWIAQVLIWLSICWICRSDPLNAPAHTPQDSTDLQPSYSLSEKLSQKNRHHSRAYQSDHGVFDASCHSPELSLPAIHPHHLTVVNKCCPCCFWTLPSQRLRFPSPCNWENNLVAHKHHFQEAGWVQLVHSMSF